MATELEQQQPPGCCSWGQGSLDLGFRISLFPGGSAAWDEQGFRTSIHFPLPQLCPDARSGDVLDLGRCRVPLSPSWADVRSLDGSARPGNAERDPGAMLWERILPCVSSLASRGTLKPWRSFAAIPAGRIRSRGRAGPGSTSRIPCGRVPEGDGCSWEEDAVAGRGSSR